MLLDQNLWVGTSKDGAVCLLPKMANRHGLISGATGTGKTVTLQVLAEGFSRLGVPVFLADVKGDLAGMAKPGEQNAKIEAQAKRCRDAHVARVGVTCPSPVKSLVYSDLLNAFRRQNDHLLTIAQTLQNQA